MLTTQIHILTAENQNPPNPKTERSITVELMRPTNLLQAPQMRWSDKRVICD
jgi:hypothetical protein